MEHDLKKEYHPTLKRRLWDYMLFIIIYISILMCCVFIWSQVNQTKYDSLLDEFTAVDDLFGKLDEVEQLFEQYIDSRSADDYPLLLAAENQCAEKIETLETMQIMSLNKRNLTDMRNMFQVFQENTGELYRYMQDNHAYAASAWTLRSTEEYAQDKQILAFLSQEQERLYKDGMTQIRQQRASLQKRSRRFYFQIAAVGLILILLGSIQAFYLADSIIYPVTVLSDGAQKIAVGSLEQIQPLDPVRKGDDEIFFLIQVFNMMILRIQDQVEELKRTSEIKRDLLEKEVENLRVKAYLKTSELKRMQTQINSHFLFNTLAMISQTAFLENADKTVELMGCTADFLRYSLNSSDKRVTLARELEALGNYIFIQEQRFGSRIQFVFHLEEEYHDIPVPALILQPIVENAIIHGLGMCRENGEIWIETGFDPSDQRVVIRISDNGEGMDSETLEKLREGIRNPVDDGRHIGLANIAQRLFWYEEQEGSLYVDSVPGQGTRVEIRLKYLAKITGKKDV